ncbi:permease [Vibrio profundum]|uniref:permease n=1 Tax=Vibrio profundum TaxID=2910247 RepID=UPI003D119A8C
MMTILPVVYLLFGVILGKTKLNIKTIASKLLTQYVIPLVIIWNITIHFDQMAGVILVAIGVMTGMFLFQKKRGKDSVRSLCFCYLNIGWLGLPIAHSLLGDDAARFMLAAYIGSSIFGNSIGASFLTKEAYSFKKVLITPAVVALLIGGALIPVHSYVEEYALPIYQACKFLMSFLGMMILGIWLSETKLDRTDTLVYVKSYFSRTFILGLLLAIGASATYLLGGSGVTVQLPWLFLICLLPPAANIIVLETSFLGAGTSAARISFETIISLIFIALYGLTLFSLPS